MSEHREPLDRETAERLLDRDFAAAHTDAAGLASLLASAASAPQVHELAGEGATLMAFREARTDRARRRKSLWRKLITFKAVVAIGAATAGGLAFASGTGMIPSPFSAAVQPAPRATPTHSDQTGRPATAPEASTHSGGPTPSADQTDSVAGMCHAYLAKPPSERGKALDTPAFSQLIVVAGGANKVDGYCEGLEAERDKSHSPKPARPTR